MRGHKQLTHAATDISIYILVTHVRLHIHIILDMRGDRWASFSVSQARGLTVRELKITADETHICQASEL